MRMKALESLQGFEKDAAVRQTLLDTLAIGLDAACAKLGARPLLLSRVAVDHDDGADRRRLPPQGFQRLRQQSLEFPASILDCETVEIQPQTANSTPRIALQNIRGN